MSVSMESMGGYSKSKEQKNNLKSQEVRKCFLAFFVFEKNL